MRNRSHNLNCQPMQKFVHMLYLPFYLQITGEHIQVKFSERENPAKIMDKYNGFIFIDSTPHFKQHEDSPTITIPIAKV